ncbi:MAG: ferritin [Spirochaetia bacterium]
MKIKDDMVNALNKQINEELNSSYIYAAMAAYFDATDLPGFAAWMKAQAKEEVGHAMRFYEFINDREGEVTLQGIDTPPAGFDSPAAAFEKAYQHEQYITQKIADLVKKAREVGDTPTENFLQWFVAEQVEEETSVMAVLKKIKMVSGSPQGLYMLDKELGARQ